MAFLLLLSLSGSSDAKGLQGVPAKTPDTAAKAPLNAYIELDTDWLLPLAEMRQTVHYRLHIERDEDIKVQPISIAPEALRRALKRSLALPAVLFDVSETGRDSHPLPDHRHHDTVHYALKFSKPGHYHIPALKISYVASQSTVQQFQSQPQQGFKLTIPTYLPPQGQPLPGNLLAPPFPPLRPWWWYTQLPLALFSCGILCLTMGLWCWHAKKPRLQLDTPLNLAALRQRYSAELQQLQHLAPVAPGPISDVERSWLRQAARLLRRLLGDWSCGDATALTGAAGISTAAILGHLPPLNDGEQQLLSAPLKCLDYLDLTANAPASIMSLEDYADILGTIEQTISRLTAPEATRVR